MFKKKIKRECWNIDYSFIKWINEHLKVYLKEASKKIDLTYYKFTYKGITYTQEEIIELMINISDYLIDNYFNNDDEVYSKTNKLLDLFSLSFHSLWW